MNDTKTAGDGACLDSRLMPVAGFGASRMIFEGALMHEAGQCTDRCPVCGVARTEAKLRQVEAGLQAVRDLHDALEAKAAVALRQVGEVTAEKIAAAERHAAEQARLVGLLTTAEQLHHCQVVELADLRRKLAQADEGILELNGKLEDLRAENASLLTQVYGGAEFHCREMDTLRRSAAAMLELSGQSAAELRRKAFAWCLGCWGVSSLLAAIMFFAWLRARH